VDHLFIHFSFTREVWSIFSQAFGMSWCALVSTIELFRKWDDYWKGSGLQAISKWARPHFGWRIWKEHNNHISRMPAFLPKLCLVKFKMPFWKIICLIKDLTHSHMKLEVVMILRKEERNVTSLYPQRVGTNPTLMVRLKVTQELWAVER
jgi:hypothetical protein